MKYRELDRDLAEFNGAINGYRRRGKKTFIPTEWETEIFVYEYHCKAPDGNEILVYIDPVTGQEKDILILLYSDGGVLTK